MKIILTVNFSNNNFNNDYKLSVSLLEKHSVLLVSSKEQLAQALPSYDILLIGQSSFDLDENDYTTTKIYAKDNIIQTLQLVENINK